MTYSVYDLKIDNNLSFTPGPTAGYVLSVNSDGSTSWIEGGGAITEITGITFSSASWSASGDLFEYTYSNGLITADSVVNIIPDNSTIDTVISAQILPKVVSSSGQIVVSAKNQPDADILVDIQILN